jgi:hypothetical protein
MMVNADKLAQTGFKYLGVSYKEMDCQAFVERCLKDCGCSLNLPGSNAWFRKMTWRGSPEECKAKFGSVPDGAFLYIWADDGGEPAKYHGDGIGNASHIGLTTGTGKGAIHSSQSRGCVCESEFHGKTIKHGGWNRVGLWDQVDYGEKINRILNGGDSGGDESVSEWATVYAPSGETVNLRQKASVTSDRLAKVPIGSKVALLSYGDKWCYVEYNGISGYMMTEFLIIGDVTLGDEPGQADNHVTLDPNTVMVNRDILEGIYNQIGDILGLRG